MQVPAYALEQALKKSVKMGAEPDCTRAVRIRRSWVAMKAKAFDDLDEERSAKEAFDTASVPQVDKSERTEGEGVAEVAGGAPIEVPKVAEDYPMHTIMSQLPYDSFDHDNFYRTILGQNCEMVIGFVPLPVGVVGPLMLDGKHVQVTCPGPCSGHARHNTGPPRALACDAVDLTHRIRCRSRWPPRRAP